MKTGTADDVVRILSIFDGRSEKLHHFIEIQNFSLSEFAQQFDVDLQQDTQMLDRYSVGPDDLTFLTKYLNEELDFDFRLYGYFIEAVRRT